jgi:enamine deaminase RidA (YjgF/YER057c/UK114 family)
MAGENGIDLRHASPNLPAPGGHYSHRPWARGWSSCPGQLPIRPAARLVDASFEDQARQALANLAAALELAGSGVPRLLQVRVYLDDMAHWPAFDRIYADWAGTPGPRARRGAHGERCISG